MTRLIRILFLLLIAAAAFAQPATTYQMPPKALADLVDAPAFPIATVSPDSQRILLAEPPPLLTIADLAEPELKLAGVRFNPQTHDQPRALYFKKLTFVTVADGKQVNVTGLPDNPRVRHIAWSPDSKRVAFTVSMPSGVELWSAGIDGHAGRVGKVILNLTLPGAPFHWMPYSTAFIARLLYDERPPAPEVERIPEGPVVQETTGRKAGVRTFEDLLKNESDAALFDWHAQSEVMLVNLYGSVKGILRYGPVTNAEPSPDGKWVLVETLHRPYSYNVPYYRFPVMIDVYGVDDAMRYRTIADLPLAEDVPIDFDAVRQGPREVEWRADKWATLVWAEAQDKGNPRLDVPVRDKLFTLEAPWNAAQQPQLLASLPLRYDGIEFGGDELALITMSRWRDRKSQTIAIQPGHRDVAPRMIFDRSSEDRYGDPGRPVLTYGTLGRQELRRRGSSIYLIGLGASPEGDRPFLDKFDLASLTSTRLFRSTAPSYEQPLVMIDDNTVLTRRESVTEPPNYFVRDLRDHTTRALTQTPNPVPQLASASKELIHYKRADGLDLSGTLYLPPGYDQKRDGALPVLMWAYPEEFKSAKAAAQVTGSPYRFTRPGPLSALPFVVRGYAVLDNPSIPILGEGSKEPNDTYVDQLVAGAKAAVDELVRRGVGDRDRMAVGGHSYGAFMTANLLAHSDLFRAGIARSGAYNRTLTPFSFQAEERTFWEVPDTYMTMSPFRYADKINEPILLIHGIDDDNSGTFPIQSERLYQAIKGLGGTARLVMLPYEAHGYRARESVMHMLWEMDQWLDKYVKNAKPRVGAGS
ncbi:MAG TPA: prolyl oligopeptidase family serine peptidase [Thermoanaerobaculia bacterium]